MYNAHPLLKQPTPEAVLWRYVDLAKFLSLLSTKRLHLASLASFSDPFDGHPPRSLVDEYTRVPDDMPEPMKSERLKLFNANLRLFQQGRELVFASCWHVNEHESAGMWSQYIREGQGIAIRTTFERLQQAAELQPTSIGGALVDYIDFDTHLTSSIDLFTWATLKRKGFEHEREFRLLALGDHNLGGMYVDIDPTQLIEDVYVAPTTPDWVTKLVEKLCADHGFTRLVRQSRLSDAPDYYPPLKPRHQQGV
jgi:hypothetical protein